MPGQQPMYQSMQAGGGPPGQQQYIADGQMGYNRPDGMQPQSTSYQPPGAPGAMGYIPPGGAPPNIPQNIPSHVPQGQGYSSLPPNVQDQQQYHQGSFNMQGEIVECCKFQVIGTRGFISNYE